MISVASRTSKRPSPYEPVASQSAVTAFARETLNGLQPRSFREGREMCGFVLEDPEGNLSASQIYPGSADECGFNWDVPPGMAAVATFHTHGSFTPEYGTETPSLIDLRTDIDDRINGYVSTPGGRFWRVDWREETITQICGEGCLLQDPSYRPCPAIEPESRYDEDSLQAYFERETGAC